MRTFDSDNAKCGSLWTFMEFMRRDCQGCKNIKIPYSHFSVNCRCGEDRGKNMRQKKFHIVCPPAKNIKGMRKNERIEPGIKKNK